MTITGLLHDNSVYVITSHNIVSYIRIEDSIFKITDIIGNTTIVISPQLEKRYRRMRLRNLTTEDILLHLAVDTATEKINTKNKRKK